MTDEELLQRVMSRALVEAEAFLERYKDTKITNGVHSEPMRPFLEQQLIAIREHAKSSGVELDRALAVGEWAPREIEALKSW